MHVELGALSELHLEVSPGDLVHNLSPSDVQNAFGLAVYGYQQLRQILERERPFSMSLYASANIQRWR